MNYELTDLLGSGTIVAGTSVVAMFMAGYVHQKRYDATRPVFEGEITEAEISDKIRSTFSIKTEDGNQMDFRMRTNKALGDGGFVEKYFLTRGSYADRIEELRETLQPGKRIKLKTEEQLGAFRTVHRILKVYDP